MPKTPAHCGHAATWILPPVRAAWPALLLAFVLVAAHWLLATHQVAHLSEGHDHGDCRVCLIGGGLDQAATPATVCIPFQAPRVDAPPVLHRSCPPQPRPHRHIRAPPARLPAT